MKTLRNTLAALLLTVCGSAFADDYAYLTIDQTGSETSIAVSNISRITFDASDMVLHLSDGTEQKLALSSLTKMFFTENGTNGIATIGSNQQTISLQDGVLHVKNAAGSTVTIYDMSGKAVRKVTVAKADTEVNLRGMTKGIYIVKVGEQSRKILNN